jgi:hypothetical protein
VVLLRQADHEPGRVDTDLRGEAHQATGLRFAGRCSHDVHRIVEFADELVEEGVHRVRHAPPPRSSAAAATRCAVLVVALIMAGSRRPTVLD